MDLDEQFVIPEAVAVDQLGQDPFARSGLPGQEHGGQSWRHGLHLVQDFFIAGLKVRTMSEDSSLQKGSWR